MAAKMVAAAAVMVALVMIQAAAWPTVGAARGKGVPTSAAGAAVLCNMTEDDLLACKPAVTKPNPAKPSVPCCDALKTADLNCLCSYKNSFALPAMGIDPDLAVGLPNQCHLAGVAPNFCA